MYNEFDDFYGESQAQEPQPPQEDGPKMETYFRPAYTPPQAQSAYEEPRHETYTPWNEQPVKKKKGWTAGKTVALALCCSLIGGILGAGGMFFGSRYLGKEQGRTQSSGDISHVYQGERPTTVIDVSHVDTSKLMTAAEVYAANVNSTVGITVGITTNFWGYQSTSAASGSGFILTEDGYILTNYHVIEGGSTITVALYDGTGYNAEVIGYDESNDIAVLKVDAKGLTPVVLGDSDNMNVGDSVIAIGNPLGELTFSLTSGVVSALNREVTMSSGITMDLIQTDCAINSGNSGGALFNMYGEVVGITNAKYSSNGSSTEASIDNIGFAIPINRVRSIVESIIEKGYISKPYIGVSVQNVSAEAQGYGLPQGAAVVSVTEGAPAQTAGLQVNDIITHVNGAAISGSQNLVDIVGACEKDDKLVLTVYRQGQTLELTIIVGEQIQSALGQQENQNQQGSQNQGGGMFPWNFGY